MLVPVTTVASSQSGTACLPVFVQGSMFGSPLLVQSQSVLKHAHTWSLDHIFWQLFPVNHSVWKELQSSLSACTVRLYSELEFVSPGSSVGRALDSVWWEHTSRLQKSGVWSVTGAWYLWASWWVWLRLRLVAGRSQAKYWRGPAVHTAQLCAYVKPLTLNSAIEQELRDSG